MWERWQYKNALGEMFGLNRKDRDEVSDKEEECGKRGEKTG